MGGMAFAALGLATPRMPMNVYKEVLSNTQELLRSYFKHVGTPIEAPGKQDYGDIDIVVNEPLKAEVDPGRNPIDTISNICEVLNTKYYISASGITNFAIPYPELVDTYIQVDIHIAPTKKAFDWELFHQSHGDLWNLVGSTIRQFGLTVNNNGMFLRIPEIEALNRKRAMIFLTDDSKMILKFLDMSTVRWSTPFDNQQDLFQYAATCRMFSVKGKKAKDELEEEVLLGIEGQEGGESGKKKLKHNDRARMKKRPIFRLWMEEFIPKCREEGRLGNAAITRQEVRDEAMSQFGVAYEYDTRLSEWNLEKNKEAVWTEAIKGSIPEDADPVARGAASRTFKSVILQSEPFDGVVPKAAQIDAEGFWDLDEIRNFVAKNWKRAAEIGVVRGEAKAREKMQAKRQKSAGTG
ncbi:hypothetical protein BJ878DRAFT_503433 [Calycina marina]|uniref:Uncharacterized protein n=1 Tax=Calycina marina TaxID=1763456 RepID=A0A9P7Z3Q3_9HELO|nr:hypothetical protein BJ878DRAFT_503433 [Calycina marina]